MPVATDTETAPGRGPRGPNHGLSTMKRAMKALGSRTIDKRTAAGKALTAWRAELVSDLGGRELISTQQAVVVEAAVRTKLLLDSIDAWLLGPQGSIVNARKRTVYPVVLQRQQLADALVRYMTTLGLQRRAQKVPSLSEYMSGDMRGDARG